MAMISQPNTEHSYEITPTQSDQKESIIAKSFTESSLVLSFATVWNFEKNKQYI